MAIGYLYCYTMIMEIGIDIGDFEAVAYYHPPLTPSSFQQRIGRGCRQKEVFSNLFCHIRGEEKAHLEYILNPLIDAYQIESIINHPTDLGYLDYRRERFYATEKLMDLGEKDLIHSNITSLKEYKVIDRDTGRQIGEIGLQAVPGTIFVLDGRVWETLSIKGLNLYARTIAKKPGFKHFRKKSPVGAFSRFLPDSLKEQ